jgi:hypothetical protein
MALPRFYIYDTERGWRSGNHSSLDAAAKHLTKSIREFGAPPGRFVIKDRRSSDVWRYVNGEWVR